jgi:hypothetical protein
MSRGPKGEKRPADVIGAAVKIVKIDRRVRVDLSFDPG